MSPEDAKLFAELEDRLHRAEIKLADYYQKWSAAEINYNLAKFHAIIEKGVKDSCVFGLSNLFREKYELEKRVIELEKRLGIEYESVMQLPAEGGDNE